MRIMSGDSHLVGELGYHSRIGKILPTHLVMKRRAKGREGI